MQELTCETEQGAEIQQQIDDHARQLSWLEQHQALLAEPASPATPRRAAPLVAAPAGQLREVDRAARLTKEFVQLSTDGFGPGLCLRDAGTLGGQKLAPALAPASTAPRAPPAARWAPLACAHLRA